MKVGDLYTDKKFAEYCLNRYYRGNKSDLAFALKELQSGNKNSLEFLQQFFQRKNEDVEVAKQRIESWKNEYARKNSWNKLKKNSLIFVIALLLITGGYLTWNYIAGRNRIKPVNHDRLYVITTSGFRARSRPNTPGGYRRLMKYGDTVTNLHDTSSGWLKFDYQQKTLYGPPKYFATEDVFRMQDSLFPNYHYDGSLETINSKTAFCVREFIIQTLRSSVKGWHIPLQFLHTRPARHAVLSVPKVVDRVRVEGEGELEKYHLLLVSRRNIQSRDSINHYALLLELLPNGSVIRKSDFPLYVADQSCYITIENVDRFLRGNITGNVYLRAESKILLRLVWSKAMESPRWEWVD